MWTRALRHASPGILRMPSHHAQMKEVVRALGPRRGSLGCWVVAPSGSAPPVVWRVLCRPWSMTRRAIWEVSESPGRWLLDIIGMAGSSGNWGDYEIQRETAPFRSPNGGGKCDGPTRRRAQELSTVITASLCERIVAGSGLAVWVRGLGWVPIHPDNGRY